MRNKLVSLLLVLGLALALPSQASAYTFINNMYYYSVMSTYDLSVCYGWDTSDPIYLSRTAIGHNGLTPWQAVYPFTTHSLGSCSGKTANIMILWTDGSAYGKSDSVAGFTEIRGTTNVMKLHVNSRYFLTRTPYSGYNLPVPNNTIDVASIVLHEMGHGWGLGESNDGTSVMGGAWNPNGGCHGGIAGERTVHIARDDRDGFIDKYDSYGLNQVLWDFGITGALCSD